MKLNFLKSGLICVLSASLLFAGCLLMARAQDDANGAGSARQSATKRDHKGAKGRKGARTAAVPARAVLVFPTEARGQGMAPLADIVTDVVKGRLAASERYDSITYRTSLPSVRRAISEGTLNQKDADPPFDSNQKVQKLAQVAGYDMAAMASIDDYQYDAAKHRATISLSIHMIDLAGGKPTYRSSAETVTTPDNSIKDAQDTEAAESAVRSLAEKIMTQLLKPPQASKPTSPAKPATGSGG